MDEEVFRLKGEAGNDEVRSNNGVVKMDINELRESGKIVYEVVAGSNMYGTNVPTSDLDLRGVYAFTKEEMNCMDAVKPSQEISSPKEDEKYYELKKFFELATECNPNIIELLYPPQDCVRIITPVMEAIMEERDIFLSKKAAMSFVGYARNQIDKATGQNKMVNQPQPEKEPHKDDYCWIIEDFKDLDYLFASSVIAEIGRTFPCRPKPLGRCGIMLSECHCAALEHIENAYRLYHYGNDARGVFRGNGMLVCESIPIEDEWKRFVGILIYNKSGYEKAHKDWKRYHDWMKNRNPSRWVGQDGGKFTYDHKNLMHCMRLLMSGLSIVKDGKPIVRFEGDQLAYLKDVRAGKFEYEELIDKAEEMIVELDSLTDASPLRRRPDIHKVNALYKCVRAIVTGG